MPDHRLPPEEAITLEQHRAMNLTRPLTDDAIGGSGPAKAKRSRQAAASAAFNHPDVYDIANRNGHGAQIDVQANDRNSRRAKTTNQCGTDAGYRAHRRRNEPACPGCRIAHAADAARRKAEREATNAGSAAVCPVAASESDPSPDTADDTEITTESQGSA